MSITAYPVAQTDVTTYWVAFNSTTGARRTDIVFNTTSLTLQYVRNRDTKVQAVTGGSPAPVTLANENTAHADWGFRHIAGGLCRIDWPDAAFLTGVDFVMMDVFGPTDTVFVPAPGGIDLTTSNPRSAALTAADVNAEVVDVLRTDTVAELTAPPAANAALSAKINWLFMKARNVITQTATTQLVKADDGTTTVGTSTVSDNGTTATRGEFA